MKSAHEKEIGKIKRHYSSMASCGDIQAKKTISRLQAQIKIMKENKENIGESKNLFNFFGENKKNMTNDSEEREYQIKKLKSKIEEMESEKNDLLYDKSSYFEGSYWTSN